MEIILKVIGYIKSNYNEKDRPPRQSVLNQEEKAIIEILPENRKAMLGLEKGEKIMVTFYFHKSNHNAYQSISHYDGKLKGVFATRNPNRFNGIGHSICVIDEVQEERIIIRGVDMFDQTPVLDLKVFHENLVPKN